MTTLTIAMTTAITLLKVLRTIRVGARTRSRAAGRRQLARKFRGSLRERLRTLVPVVLALAVIGLGTIIYAELVFVLLEYAE